MFIMNDDLIKNFLIEWKIVLQINSWLNSFVLYRFLKDRKNSLLFLSKKKHDVKYYRILVVLKIDNIATFEVFKKRLLDVKMILNFIKKKGKKIF